MSESGDTPPTDNRSKENDISAKMASTSISANSSPVSNSTLAQTVHDAVISAMGDFKRQLDEQNGKIEILDKRTDKVTHRVEMIDRKSRRNSVLIFNFPAKEFGLTPREMEKGGVIRKFLTTVMKVPEQRVASMVINDVQIYKHSSNEDIATVTVNFGDCDDKKYCWSYARNLAEFNKDRQQFRTRWADDLTPEQLTDRQQKRQQSMEMDQSTADGNRIQWGNRGRGGGRGFGSKRGRNY